MRILFVHNYPRGNAANFVMADLDLLRERYEVDEFSLAERSWRRGPLFSPAAWRIVAQYDMVYAWFGVCAPIILMARTLGKPAFVCAGGVDAVHIPQISYGLGNLTARRRWLVLFGFRLASRVLVFSEASRLSLQAQPGIKPDNLVTLYLGIDIDYFTPVTQKKPQVLTVSYITQSNLRRKGILTFIETAKLAPNISFLLAGRVIEPAIVEQIKRVRPGNLALLGELSQDQLRSAYQQALIYAQLSWHEGFGVSLAEAMACGCIPVVTKSGSLPEIVGDVGFYVSLEDAQAAADACLQVISSDSSRQMQQARDRIVHHFPLDKRRQSLFEYIDRLN